MFQHKIHPVLDITKKVAIYSSAYNDAEIEKLRKFVLANDLEVVGEYSADNETNNFHKLIHDIHENKAEVVIVYELNQLHNKPDHAIKTIEQFSKLKIDFISIKDQLNTTTQGKLVFSLNLIKAIEVLKQEHKATLIKAGLAAAEAKGKKLGRPRISKNIKAKAIKLREQGRSYRATGVELGIDEKTVRNWIRESNQQNNENN